MKTEGLLGALAPTTNSRSWFTAATLGACIMLAPGISRAQEVYPIPGQEFPPKGVAPVAKQKERSRIVAREEFYYLERGMRTPLSMARSFVVKFNESPPPIMVPVENPPSAAPTDTTDAQPAAPVVQEIAKPVTKEEYLKKYNPYDVKNIAGVYQRAEFQASYMPTATPQDMVATLRRALDDPILDVAPVFVVDGMGAVVDGIYLETVTPLSRDFVLKALDARFGQDAFIHELTPEGALWHVSFKKLFFLGGEKLPLHMLNIANIMQNSDSFAWVKRAFPKFHFLRSPVQASLTVTPVSGTVGEKRVVTLAIRIFGKPNEVSIDEKDIPEFFQGKFTPLADNKPPSESFRSTSDVFEKRPRRQVGPNEWLVEHVYGFGLYAPEKEWTFSGMSIPYVYKGQSFKADISPMTFFVRPHLDEKFALEDMPEAPLLSTPKFSGFSANKPGETVRWYDIVARYVGGRGVLANVFLGTTIFGSLAFFGLVLTGVLHSPWAASALGWGKREGNVLNEELAKILRKAETAGNSKIAFKCSEDALSHALHAGFETIPARNATYQDVKRIRSEGPRQDLMKRLDDLLDAQKVSFEQLFDELESRNAPHPHFDRFDATARSNCHRLLRVRIEDIAKEISRYVEGGHG